MEKQDIEKNLKIGWCFFNYFKSSKEHKDLLEKRFAVGTLNNNLFTYERKTDKEMPTHLVTYWDFKANSFRSFKVDNFINFIQIDINPYEISDERIELL